MGNQGARKGANVIERWCVVLIAKKLGRMKAVERHLY